MYKRLLAIIALTALAACGGGGGATGPTIPSGPGGGGNPTGTLATQHISFTLPLGGAKLKAPQSSNRRSPQYVSPSSAFISLFINGTAVLNKASIATTAGTTTGSVDLGNGQSFSYAATVTNSPAGDGYPTYYSFNGTANVLPGAVKIGVVLQDLDNFVLSEDQETYTLSGGTNPAATLYLKGVADSAYLCDTACDGQPGTPNADGTFTLVAFPSDREGAAIVEQYYDAGDTQPVPLANGPIQLIETDGLGTLTISNAGPFDDPGHDSVISTYDYAGHSDPPAGHQFTLKCNRADASAVVAMEVGSSTQGSVDGFDYTQQTDDSALDGVPAPGPVWTTANQLIGPVLPWPGWGNELTVNCDASMSVTIASTARK